MKNGGSITETAEKAMKSYKDALQTGSKLNETAGLWWSTLLRQADLTQDWQKQFARFTRMTEGAMPAVQRQMEEVVEVMNKSSRTGAELIKKALDAAQAPTFLGSQAKWMEFWTSSLKAAQSNAEALTQLNTGAINQWLRYVQNYTEVTEVRVPKIA